VVNLGDDPGGKPGYSTDPLHSFSLAKILAGGVHALPKLFSLANAQQWTWERELKLLNVVDPYYCTHKQMRLCGQQISPSNHIYARIRSLENRFLAKRLYRTLTNKKAK